MRAKHLLKLIPNQVRITRKVAYAVVWCDGFPAGPDRYGECCFDTKQIRLNKNQSPTEAFKTLLHETLHAIDLETEGPPITEKQVRKLEEGLFRLLTLNGVLK